MEYIGLIRCCQMLILGSCDSPAIGGIAQDCLKPDYVAKGSSLRFPLRLNPKGLPKAGARTWTRTRDLGLIRTAL